MADNKKKKIVKMMDIIPTGNDSNKRVARKSKSKKLPEKKQDKKISELVDKHNLDADADFFDEIKNLEKEDENIENNATRKRKKLKKKHYIILWTSVMVALAIIFYLSIYVLPKVTITIEPHRENFQYNDSISVNVGLNKINVESMSIPGEIFKQTKNLVLSFKANGKKYVERKARGKITIYNNYSSAPQVLVENTRFETPDGKIYRITKRVTVPGAKVVNGKIESASIEVDAVADKPGEEYNIGPVEKFTIPGFAGTDRFYGFYGRSFEPMTGGVIGEVPYPTDDDIISAETKLRSDLMSALKTSLTLQIPDGFVLLDGAYDVKIKSIDVDTRTDEKGEFKVYGEGEASAMVFRESDELELLRKKGIKELELNDNFVEKEKTIKHMKPFIDWEVGTMEVPVEYNVVLWSPVNVDEIKNIVKGKNAVELKTSILSIPYIDKIIVEFWPFWVKKAPEKDSRIFINIQ